MMPGKDDGFRGEPLDPLKRGKHLRIASAIQVRASTIPDKDGIAREKVRRFRCADQVRALAGAMSGSMQDFDREFADVDEMAIHDFIDPCAGPHSRGQARQIQGMD